MRILSLENKCEGQCHPSHSLKFKSYVTLSLLLAYNFFFLKSPIFCVKYYFTAKVKIESVNCHHTKLTKALYKLDINRSIYISSVGLPNGS